MKFIYYCFTFAYCVPLSFYLFWRSWFKREGDLERLGRRLPAIHSRQSGHSSNPFWLVASSVGEVTVALRLVAELKDRGETSILSVTTPAGRLRASNASCPPDAVIYHPLDLPHYIRRVLRHFSPRAILLIETELWPTLIESAAESDIPVFQVSGSISRRSFRRYRALKPLFGPALSSCRSLLMQTQQDADFVTALTDGATEVAVLGSLKEEYTEPPAEQMRACREKLAAWRDKTIWVCGSTRPGEEKIILKTFTELKQKHHELRLILAPRHLERVGEVTELIKREGLSFLNWSGDSPVGSASDAVLVDEIGWLNAIYHCSQLAFVGGTLAPIGGHNLLEPAFAGLPVVYGPNHEEQQVGHELLQEYELGFVTDVERFRATVDELLVSVSRDTEYERRASRLRNRGKEVVSNYVDRILALSKDQGA